MEPGGKGIINFVVLEVWFCMWIDWLYLILLITNVVVGWHETGFVCWFCWNLNVMDHMMFSFLVTSFNQNVNSTGSLMNAILPIGLSINLFLIKAALNYLKAFSTIWWRKKGVEDIIDLWLNSLDYKRFQWDGTVWDRVCVHEFVQSLKEIQTTGVAVWNTLFVARRHCTLKWPKRVYMHPLHRRKRWAQRLRNGLIIVSVLVTYQILKEGRLRKLCDSSFIIHHVATCKWTGRESAYNRVKNICIVYTVIFITSS